MMRFKPSSCAADQLVAAGLCLIGGPGQFIAVATTDEKSVTVVRESDGRVTRDRCHWRWLAVRVTPEKVEVYA